MGGPGGGFVAGVADYGAAHRLLFATGLWKLFLVPGLLSVLYVPCSLVAGYLLLRRLPGFLHDHWIPGFLQSGLTMSVLSVLTAMVGVALGFILFRNVIMILYSPFLGLLSEATERAVSGPGTAEGGIRIPFGEIVRSAVRGSSLSLLTLMLAAVGLLLACLMALLPVLGTLLGSIVTVLVTWFLAGAGFVDPPLERRNFTVWGALRLCWNFRGRILGQGASFSALLMIPLAGWFLAPGYGMVAGTIGALSILEEGDRVPEGPGSARGS